MDLKKAEWNNSYKQKDNFVFYPHEEVIRFVSKYIKQKTGMDKFIEKKKVNRSLVLGCGIGRHMIFLDDFDIDTYGIDLSEKAIKFAKNWFDYENRSYLKDNLVIGSSTNLPYEDNEFSFIVSHGVLDSMDFKIAKKTVSEANRVLQKNGLFYFDVITNKNKISKKVIVNNKHEKGTIQYYYNENTINSLLDDFFKIKEIILVERNNLNRNVKNYRYHIIAEKR